VRTPQLKRNPLGASTRSTLDELRHAPILLALAVTSTCGLRAQETTTHRTLLTDTSVAPPYLTYRNSLATIYFDTTHAFHLMQDILEDSSSPGEVRERFQRQLDSARAAIQRGAHSWKLSDKYVVGHLLENVPFSATDRRTQQRVPHLDMEDYNQHCGFLCGRGEHRFRLPDGSVFLKLLMWVS
jgi:hypothetical protein